MITMLYLIRHGETALNRLGVLLGSTDCMLNDTGVSQSTQVAKAFTDIDLDEIISSPLVRAYTTASYIAKIKKLKIKKNDALKEIDFGAWEGMHYKEIIEENPIIWEERGKNWLDFSPVDGESFQLFYYRIEIAIGEILKKYEGKRIAIVSHDGVMKAIASSLLKVGQTGFWNFRFEHGKYSLFEINDGHCIIRKINV